MSLDTAGLEHREKRPVRRGEGESLPRLIDDRAPGQTFDRL
jgi:hypothetical protein